MQALDGTPRTEVQDAPRSLVRSDDAAGLCQKISICIEKAETAVKKAEQFYTTAAQHIRTLQEQFKQTWQLLLKEHCGFGRTRAFQILAIADGRASVEAIRDGNAERQRISRERMKQQESVTSRTVVVPVGIEAGTMTEPEVEAGDIRADVTPTRPPVNVQHDTAGEQFDAHVLELIRRTKGAKPQRFLKTAVPTGDLYELAVFLTELVALKKLATEGDPTKDKPEQAAIAPVKITSPLVTPVYDVGQSRAFCGPTAMSAVTGKPISVVRDAVRQASGKIHKSNGSAWPVMGMHNADLVAAMRLLGWRVAEEWHEPEGGKPYTLDSFARDRSYDGPFIVGVTGHYVAISQGEFCDTVTVLPKDLSAGVLDRPGFSCQRKGSAWVRSWWRFEKLSAPVNTAALDLLADSEEVPT
jgi:hypothetical protein